MAILAKKQQSCSLPCQIMQWAICILLLIVSIAALVGVFQTHVIDVSPFRVQFGSTSGSLSILAFTVAVVAWGKQVVSCMGKCEVCTK